MLCVVVVSCLLTVCLPFLCWLFGGLMFPCLCATQVLSTSQHPRQLLGPHIKPLACLLGHPLIDVFPQHLQPYCCHQDVSGAIARLVGQTGDVGDGQDRLSHFFLPFFLCRFGLLVFNWVQEPLWDVQLNQRSHSPIYDGQQGGLVRHPLLRH